MILDAAETVLGNFGFERTVYGDSRKRNGNGGRNLQKKEEEILRQRLWEPDNNDQKIIVTVL